MQDNRVFEWLSDTRDLEEIGCVSDEEVDSRCRVSERRADSKERSSKIGTSEKIAETGVGGQFLFNSSGFTDFEEFFLEKFFWEFVASQTTECPSGFFVSPVIGKPSRGFGNEKHEDSKKHGDDEKNGNGDLIAVATVDCGSVVVDNGAD